MVVDIDLRKKWKYLFIDSVRKCEDDLLTSTHMMIAWAGLVFNKDIIRGQALSLINSR